MEPSTETNIILFTALQKMAEWIRNNPPGDLDQYLKEPALFSILAGGKERDPEGAEYVSYFINEARKEFGFNVK